MFNESNFIVRTSGKRDGCFYIDYGGEYRISGIAKAAGLDVSQIKEIYLSNKGLYDESQEIYYFESVQSAKNVVLSVLKKVGVAYRGKLLFLTDIEIEYIRKALINEVGNYIHVNDKVKDNIFKKLNN